ITTDNYSCNYAVPTPKNTGTVKYNVIHIHIVIGSAEIAISDSRSGQPSLHELAKLVGESRVGGLLRQKAGVTHFHTGPGKEYLTLMHQLVDCYVIPPANLYATHITRSKEVLDDALKLENRGYHADMTQA